MKTCTILLSAFMMLVIAMSPAMAEAETIQASEVINSSCKGFDGASASKTRAAEEDGAISWSLSYENGLLTLTWYDFVANCCPDGFGSKIEVEDGKIIFSVWEEGSGLCDCVCPFDITSTYENVAPGHYKLYFGDEMVGEADIDDGFRQNYSTSGASVKSINGEGSSLVLKDGKVIARCPGKFRVDVYNISGARMCTLEGTDFMEISTRSGSVSLLRLTTEYGEVSNITIAR